MNKLLLLIAFIWICTVSVNATEMDFTAPEVPASGEELLAKTPESFSDGLRTLMKELLPHIHPAFSEAAGVCLRIVGIAILLSLTEKLTDTTKHTLRLVGTVSAAVILLGTSRSMIQLGADTVMELSTYGKLLLPVLTAAMAAHGGISTAGALYAGTAFFDSLLSSLIANILIPSVYLYLALSIANRAISEKALEKLGDLVKSTVTWGLKILLYIFTGYMSITGVVSGSTDAMAVKAAKVTMSGMVPVVGGILSDASEAVLVSAGVMKNAAGAYGILAILAVVLGPFLRIGCQYCLLKLTSALCEVLAGKDFSGLVQDFSGAMGLILGMTAAVSVMLLISTVCFMKGLG